MPIDPARLKKVDAFIEARSSMSDQENPIEVRRESDAVVVTIKVESLDKWAGSLMVKQVREMIDHMDSSQRLVLDLQHISHSDSSGLATLIAAQKEVQKHDVSLTLCGIGEKLLAVLHLTGIEKIFEVKKDVAAAIGG